MKILIREVKIERKDDAERRARDDFGDIQKLADNIKAHGLIQPIVVDDYSGDSDHKYVLIVGERRLRAAVLAGLEEVDAMLRKDTTARERKAIELAENLHRKDFTWMEQNTCLKQLHDLQQDIHGKASHDRHTTDKGWGVRQTADELGRSVGSVGEDLKLARNLEEHPELVKRVRRLPKTAARKIVNQTIEALELKKLVASKMIDIGVDFRLGDSLDLIDTLPDRSVDLLLTDPPFAIDDIVEAGVTDKATYNVTASNVGTYDEMVALHKKLMPKIAKKLKIGAHVYMFYGCEMYETLRQIMLENGILVDGVPLIWNKMRATVMPKDFRYVASYEPILFGHNQAKQRSLWHPVLNILPVSPIAGQCRVHPLQRPFDLLKILIENSSSVGETVLDVFAGSGSTLHACKKLQRNAIGFELDEGNYLRAMTWLREGK